MMESREKYALRHADHYSGERERKSKKYENRKVWDVIWRCVEYKYDSAVLNKDNIRK